MEFNLSEAIIQRRKQKKLTKKKLAELTGLSESYLWRLEKDHRQNPSLDSVIKIARALDLSIDELVFGTVPPDDAHEVGQFLTEFKQLDTVSKKGILAQMKEINRHKS